MSHANHVERYPGTLAELATELGDLRYDALATFLEELAAKLEADSLADSTRGRGKLAAALQAASEQVAGAAEHIAKAWHICEPHM
ncbi:hypothetical protein GobsT_65070 [Gemmata obscuriglobus]|uniref:Uncharacterized protein n=1 Tax=Gemmata obscuriglobus TaxID=114 RepID=A0A2Z3GVY0_9BACT|nr:hypothetical protein [Gemmata obscuriglobus]AWM35797.1 hypothetical protein C1280_01315 [Gemmata obscuriglobus]QEG31663.1 hypothetical protein GobsT_65070 [Gemmata obscuriglobus]VTS11009.1 Uncharacterized protein OS=Haliscomenobacter hydrossis (strain ATCC 27775 / DSM 1100 / LMG 10767 / O) GN=Halhy_1853 PE=4 SV=1 [Gemmata obscuriglobus UQM 2246]